MAHYLSTLGRAVTRKSARLPNGRRVRCLSAFQVPEIYRQVHQYFQHGITVRPGDTVIDVGANIGLFCLLAHEMGDGKVNVYSFEPVPAIYSVLEENLHTVDPKRLRPFPFGLSSGPRTVQFSYRPNMATLSSVYGDDGGEMEEQVTEALIRNLAATPWHLRWLVCLPRFAQQKMIRKIMRSAFEAKTVTCELRRLSDFLRDEPIETIDLLKIDAEKAEWDVLQGIDAADWPRIRQVVMELHDIDGRREKVEALLRNAGFQKIVVEQERLLQGSNVYALFALRETSAFDG